MAITDLIDKGSSFLEDAKSYGDALVSLAGSVGFGGMKFDIIDDEAVNLKANITNHYTEDNNPVQDDVVLQPTVFTLRGKVGEFVDRMSAKENFMDKATRQISTCLSYIPTITQTASLVSGAIKNPTAAFGSLSNTLKTGSNLFDLYNSINLPVDKQSSAYLYFESLMRAKQFITVQTPWRKYPKMMITSITARQSGASKDYSNFAITVQEMRVIKTVVAKKANAGSSKAQKSESKNLGFKEGLSKAVSSTWEWIKGDNE